VNEFEDKVCRSFRMILLM